MVGHICGALEWRSNISIPPRTSSQGDLGCLRYLGLRGVVGFLVVPTVVVGIGAGLPHLLQRALRWPALLCHLEKDLAGLSGAVVV
jgi:hypothetical protein